MTTTFSYRPGRYFAVTFLATYILWILGAWASFNAPALYMPLMLFGLLAPFIVSSAMLFTSGDRTLKREYLDRLYNPRRFDRKSLPVFLFVMPVAVLLSIALSVAGGGSTDQFALAEGFSFSTGAVPVLVTLLLAAGLEELGWRGYAFDSLESRFGFVRASLIFGVLWSLWHLPLVFVKDSYQYGLLQENIWYAINFFVSIIPMGIIISWICMKNGRSVIATIVFHFIVNISQEALAMTQTTKCIETGVLTLVAFGILLADRRAIRTGDEMLVSRPLAEAV
ncbi:MAG: CPBP family intramembrane glutamic endopeptidase [Gemmatimonadales bacterium]